MCVENDDFSKNVLHKKHVFSWKGFALLTGPDRAHTGPYRPGPGPYGPIWTLMGPYGPEKSKKLRKQFRLIGPLQRPITLP